MDRTNEGATPSRDTKGGAFTQGFSLLPYDVAIFILGILFSRCSAFFGAHPFGAALVSALTERVWIALAGCAVGAISLGSDGIIYAVVAVISAFLRLAITGGKPKGEDGRSALFTEGVLLRACSAVISGFVAAVYFVLPEAFSLTSVLKGASMIIIPPVTVFALYYFFSSGIDVKEIFVGEGDPLSLSGLDEKRRLLTVLFGVGGLVLVFLTGLSLSGLSLFGISPSYVFSAVITLITARKLGALRGGAVGFASLIGVNSQHAVCFALSGIGAGILSGAGIGYSLAVGGVIISLWSGYSLGLNGFLSTFPEYVIGAALSFPLMKKVTPLTAREGAVGVERSASDMVGTMALSYRSKYRGTLDHLEEALAALSSVVRRYGEESREVTREEYEYLITDCQERFCKTCPGYRACLGVGRHGCADAAAMLAEKLMDKKQLTADDVNTDSDKCIMAVGIAAEINRASAELEAERHKRQRAELTAEDYSLIAKMINEARCKDDAERAVDASLSERLKTVFYECGFSGGEIRAFGNRKKHIIAAGEDEDGRKITSDNLKKRLEETAGVRLGAPEYFRRDKTVLMECSAGRIRRVSCATAELSGTEGEVSGDTARHFESKDDRAFTLISDGMGSGKSAKEASELSARFLEGALSYGCTAETSLHALNRLLRERSEECSSTVDLFEMDLLTGEAVFTKCGAAPSYVKRDSSIFRIRSRTAPLGLMKTIDAERIRVEVKPSDYVIMISDGISGAPEDTPWLLELLAKPAPDSLSEYANLILSEAVKNQPTRDDMTVAVLRIE